MTSAGTYPTLKATGKCAHSGRELRYGESYIATLVEQAGTISRQDFALDAWAQGARAQPPAILLGSWRTTFAQSESQKPALMSDAEMLDLFEEMGSAGDARQVRFRYILALLLIRRRLLRVVSTRRSAEGTVLSVLRRGEGESGKPPSDVLDPGLDDGAIAEAVEQIAGMTGPAQTATPPANQ